jgi:hypothetical protein
MVHPLLPRDGLLQTQRLPDCSHELAEYLLDEQLPARVTLDDLHLPPGCQVLAVARDHRFAPLEPRMALSSLDHVLVAQPQHARRDVSARIGQLSRGRT